MGGGRGTCRFLSVTASVDGSRDFRTADRPALTFRFLSSVIGDIRIFFRPILVVGADPTGERTRSVVVVADSTGVIITVGRSVIDGTGSHVEKKRNGGTGRASPATVRG